MNRATRFSVLAVLAAAGTLAVAQPAQPGKDKKPPTPAAAPAAKPAAQPAGAPAEMQLPPGMTMEDMQACMEAGTPGEMHAYLAQSVGTWSGKTKMWMDPDAPPMESTCTTVISAIMDGRYIKCETSGEMPGMGMFMGSGVYAFDNVTQKFQSTWIDNMSTGIATGTGERSSDGKTMTWNLNFNCPVTKKSTTMREVQRHTGKDTSTMEMYGINPKTGKEYKMMEIQYTRKATASAPTGG
jgi:hypothetical protein